MCIPSLPSLSSLLNVYTLSTFPVVISTFRNARLLVQACALVNIAVVYQQALGERLVVVVVASDQLWLGEPP
jgi:hypothetical protein